MIEAENVIDEYFGPRGYKLIIIAAHVWHFISCTQVVKCDHLCCVPVSGDYGSFELVDCTNVRHLL